MEQEKKNKKKLSKNFVKNDLNGLILFIIYTYKGFSGAYQNL